MSTSKQDSREQRKPMFRKALQDFAQTEANLEFGQLKEMAVSHYMARFYVEKVLGVMEPGLVPDPAIEEEMEPCFVDGSSDQGIDFLYRRDRFVLILQVKYRGSGKTEDKNEVGQFFSSLRRIHPVTGRDHKKNSRLLEAVGDIDWKRDNFRLEFISLGKAADDIRVIAEAGPPPLDIPGLPDLQDRVEVIFRDESDLNEIYREALSAGRGIPKPVEVRFKYLKDQPPWIEYGQGDQRRSFVGCISASQLYELYKPAAHKAALFSLNIRDFVGDTPTNKEMIRTAHSKPSDFFFFNNGVSAVATKIEPDPSTGILKCDGFSIINGAQTVKSLAKAHQKDAQSAGLADVLIRVTQVSLRNKPSEQAFLENVTRFNNTQNAVKISDFRSNDAIQRQLNQRFGQLSRGGKKFFYKNKRTADRPKQTISIGMEEFIKTLHSFHYGPPDVFGGASYLFDTGEEGGYYKVFSDETGPWEDLDSDQFSFLAGTWFICDYGREALKSVRQEKAEDEVERLRDNPETQPIVKNALERRWLFYFVLGELLRQKYRAIDRDLKSEILRLGKPKWMEQDTNCQHVLDQYVKYAAQILISEYRSASKGADFVHRNWFRQGSTLQRLRESISDNDLYLEQLLSPLHGD